MHLPTQKSQHLPHQFIRKKLMSLRTLNNSSVMCINEPNYLDAFKKLQASLQKDNQQVQPISEPVAQIPGFQEKQVECKLWKYFQSKMEGVENKVQKEKVNVCEKQFIQIKKQVNHRKQLNKINQTALEGIIREKYKLIHSIFTEIKQQNSFAFFNQNKNNKKKGKDSLQPINNQKVEQLEENISEIRNQIVKYQRQVENIRNEQNKINKQWLTFVKNMLKKQYYLRDGVNKLLQQLVQMEYTPNNRDFPDILDSTSKKCLIIEYQNLKQQNINGSTKKERSRILSQTKNSMGDLIKKDLMREVYKDTKEYMSNWIKKSGWKEGLILPRIKPQTEIPKIDWKTNERTRLTHIYEDKKVLTRIKNILFGSKVQTNF